MRVCFLIILVQLLISTIYCSTEYVILSYRLLLFRYQTIWTQNRITEYDHLQFDECIILVIPQFGFEGQFYKELVNSSMLSTVEELIVHSI